MTYYSQFVIGDSLSACLDALPAGSHDDLHLLERININLDVQKSIVPTAVNLSRFIVSGTLPSLHVNLSDSKYKALMRLIDISIPKFDEDDHNGSPSVLAAPRHLPTFQLPVALFGMGSPDFDIEDQSPEETGSSHKDIFFEAEEHLQIVSLLAKNYLLQLPDRHRLATGLSPASLPRSFPSRNTSGVSIQKCSFI